MEILTFKRIYSRWLDRAAPCFFLNARGLFAQTIKGTDGRVKLCITSMIQICNG